MQRIDRASPARGHSAIVTLVRVPNTGGDFPHAWVESSGNHLLAGASSASYRKAASVPGKVLVQFSQQTKHMETTLEISMPWWTEKVHREADLF